MTRRTKYYEDLSGGKELSTDERKKLVRQNWENTAREMGKQKDATIRDLYFRELNTGHVSKFIKAGESILDVGCGNGMALSAYAEKAKHAVGVDYIPDFIKAAEDLHADKIKTGKLEFHVGDILDLSPIKAKYDLFDVVIAERTLINLASWEEQIKAIDQLISVLKKGGLLILTEVTQQGHESVDKLRAEFDLPILQKHWNNVYLDEEKLAQHLKGAFELVERENFGVYILVSRIVHAAQVFPEEPSFDAKINEIAFKLAQKLRFPEGPGHQIVMVYRKTK